jgi:excisionase family DNA binding protein
MAALVKFVSLSEAAGRLSLSVKHLRRLIDNGKISAVLVDGETVVSERDVIKMTPTPKEELPEYKRFKKLKGNPIWLSEAERKYGIAYETILKWANKGIIKKLGMQGNKLLVDEADVAYCKVVYDRIGGSQGKRIFNGDGTPFTPRPSKRKTRQVIVA